MTELDGQPALERLQEVARAAAREEGGERVVKLLQRALLVGSSIEPDEIDETDEGGARRVRIATPSTTLGAAGALQLWPKASLTS